MAKETLIITKVSTNADISSADIAKLLQRLINAGLQDARDTVEDGEGDVVASEQSLDLNIWTPEVHVFPRVLVSVAGGVADYVCDEGVDVVVFDHDNFKDDPTGTDKVPLSFRDLADPLRIPVVGEAEEKVQHFLAMLGTADTYRVDEGPLLVGCDISPILHQPDNEVVRFTWTDVEGDFSTILTEEGIAKGAFNDRGVFECEDKNGDPTFIEFFDLKRKKAVPA